MLMAAIAFLAFLLATLNARFGIVIGIVAALVVFLDSARILPSPSWEKGRQAICWNDARGIDILVAVPPPFCTPKK